MQLLLPSDVVVADKFDPNANTQIVDIRCAARWGLLLLGPGACCCWGLLPWACCWGLLLGPAAGACC